MRPQLLFCQTAFGKNLPRIREYITTHGYDGVEWAWDGWRLMMPRERRQRRLDDLRQASRVSSAHAPYTDLEVGHKDPDHAAAAVRILQDYIDAATELGAHHLCPVDHQEVGPDAPPVREVRPVRAQGQSYQVCLGCGIKRLFDEQAFQSYGPYSYDLNHLIEWDRNRRHPASPPAHPVERHAS